MANNILPFCPTDTGTNLLTQGDYSVATDRTVGNQPGVASAKLVNKAIRQATFMASQLAQYIADRLGQDVLDDGNTSALLAQIKRAYSGSILNYSAKTTTYTVLNTDDFLTFSGSFTATLPSAAANPGKTYHFKNIGTGSVTIARAGSDTIDGATTLVMSVQYESYILISDGVSAWSIFG